MSRLRQAAALPVLILLGLLVTACSHDIESPAATAKAVSPDLVCAEELTTKVTLTGDGFTPMPSKTLESATQLLLPQVKLSQTKDLAGAPASGSFTIPDDPTNPKASGLHWTSEQQMELTVDPALMLSPGLYDIVVTNPDGKHAATFPGEFVAVPRPKITGVEPDILCDAEGNQTVTLVGTTFLQVAKALPTVVVSSKSGGMSKTYGVTMVGGGSGKCAPLPGMLTESPANDCTTATFTIKQGDFPPGTYDLVLTNPSPASCHSTDPITITVVPPPKVLTIVPDLVCTADGDQSMTITGTGFLEFMGKTPVLPSIALGSSTFAPSMLSGCTPIPGMFTEGPAETCTTISFTIPKGMLPVTMPTTFPVVVTNPPPANCHSLEMVNLEVVPPPTINTASPVAVCDMEGMGTVNLAGGNFLVLGTGSSQIVPAVTIADTASMMIYPVMGVTPTGCTTVMGMFTEGMVQECTGLTLTLPMTPPPGTYSITVTNPKPADCSASTTMTADITVVLPPVVSSVVPMAICAGGGNLTVNGQNFTQGTTVSLEAMGQPTIMSSSAMVNMAGTQTQATFGGPLTVGNMYDVVVDDGGGCTDMTPHKQVTVVAGPTAFFADPDVVFNGINTRVTIYLTALTCNAMGPCATVTLTPAGMTMPAIPLMGVTTVPGHPNRLQAIIPQGTMPGSYDLHVDDATMCPTTLPAAVTVTSTTSIALNSIVPPFGWTQQETPVTILRDTMKPTMTSPFVATPRVFLNPSPTQPAGNGCPALSTAIQLQSVSFVDTNTLTAVVPPNEPTCLYDLVVVNPNPDDSVGLLSNAFTVQSAQPPTITSVTPASIAASTGQMVVVAGTGFNGSTISVSCVNAGGMTITPPPNVTSGAVTCNAGGCTQPATIDGSAVGNGGICVVRVTNADGSYFDFSAVGVTTPAGKLPGTSAGPSLNVARRALVSGAGNATAAARFVYAIGGDGGTAMANAPFSSTEVASVDLFGNMGAWQLQPTSTLATARSFAASSTVGRYIYVAGGTDGTNTLVSAERALVLSPDEAPVLDIDDLVPKATGLDPGYWIYRVSATFAATDPDNPGGESLASDEIIVRVPVFTGMKIQVVLAWAAPVDALGAPLPNVSGYNVYRTAAVNGMSGTEVLLATVTGTMLTYTDDGSATPGTQKPLPLGSTGKWAQLPAMATARKGAGGAAGFDPSAANKLYFYALLGLGPAGTELTSYEYLTVTVQPNGHHTAGAWTTGASASSAGRWQLGGFVAGNTVSSSIPAGTTYVYLGQGENAAGGSVSTVEAGKIAAGGDLGALNDTIKSFGGALAGYGALAANDNLYAFGGLGAAPSKGAKFTGIWAAPPAVGTWVDEGIQLVQARYLMGSAVQSGFIFLVGGETGGGVASATTETVIW